jgi:hypothetical protein
MQTDHLSGSITAAVGGTTTLKQLQNERSCDTLDTKAWECNMYSRGRDSSAASPLVECLCLSGVAECVIADSRLQC